METYSMWRYTIRIYILYGDALSGNIVYDTMEMRYMETDTIFYIH